MKVNKLLFIALVSCIGTINGQIYVSTDGDDTNDGSFASPYKTISAAVANAVPNAVIEVRAGTYNEEVSINTNAGNSPLTIRAFSNEKPEITGVDALTNWTNYQGNIYYTTVAQEVTQLFVDNKQMDYARWPNFISDDLFNQGYGTASQIDYNNLGETSSITDSNLSQLQSIDLIGAKVWMPFPLLKKWNSMTETVHTQSSSSISFTTSNNNASDEQADVDYHLTGKLGLLDAEKEWFYDTTTNRLYFYAPSGVDPSTLTVLGRTRINGIAVKGDNVTIKGIDFFAATIDIEGNSNLIESCNVMYPRPYFHTVRWKELAGVTIKGNLNSIKKCEVAYSWGSGISMRKKNNNFTSEDGLIEECLVHDCNWSGSIAPGIWVDGRRMTVRRNTIYACGRSGIRQYDIFNSLVEKNHIYDYGKINHDLGGIKGGKQDFENTVWRYNYCHTEKTSGVAKAGIYLDASNDNSLVHHNVMYNVHLSINGEVNNDKVYNNTLVSKSKSREVFKHFIRAGTDWDYRTVTTWNNLSTGEVLGTDIQNNLRIITIDDLGFVGRDYGDFRLIETSQAINYGLDIAGITDGSINEPDAGAFEFGDEGENGTWMPGITWSPDWNQEPTGGIEVNDGVNGGDFNFNVLNENDQEGWIMRYDWDFGDGTKSYGKVVSHSYSSNGTFDVTLTLKDNLGAVTTIVQSVEVDGDLSVNENTKTLINFYPNPIIDRLTLKSEVNFQEIKIFDLSGRLVFTKSKINDRRISINVAYLSVGVYILEVASVDEGIERHKIIKK